MANLKAGQFYRLSVDRPGKILDGSQDIAMPKGTVVKLVRLYATTIVVMDKDNNWTAFQKGLWMSYLRKVSPIEAIRFQGTE